MNQQRTEQMIELAKNLEDRFDQKELRKLDLDQLVRILIRLDSLLPGCEDCEKLLVEMENCLNQLAGLSGTLDKQEYDRYKKLVNQAVNHLQKKHKLVTPGYYTSIYIGLGLSFGVTFGLTLVDNLALGLCFGMAIGVAIGSALDADARKKRSYTLKKGTSTMYISRGLGNCIIPIRIFNCPEIVAVTLKDNE
jgi:hypothetical protein